MFNIVFWTDIFAGLKVWAKVLFGPKSVNVGISVAGCILNDGTYVEVTRKGKVTPGFYFGKYFIQSSDILTEVMNDSWVPADNNVIYNRANIQQFTISFTPYWIYPDGTEEV